MHPIEKGRELEHAIYGSGVVLSSDEERTVVQFRRFGRKLFVTTMMNARLIGVGTNQDSVTAAQRTEECRRASRGSKAMPSRPVDTAAHSRSSQRNSDSTLPVLIQ